MCIRSLGQHIVGSRPHRDLGPKVFAREYENVWDALGTRFFDIEAVDAAFGAVQAMTPPTGDDPSNDPVVHRTSAFQNKAFAA